jgi:hypothetical protein
MLRLRIHILIFHWRSQGDMGTSLPNTAQNKINTTKTRGREEKGVGTGKGEGRRRNLSPKGPKPNSWLCQGFLQIRVTSSKSFSATRVTKTRGRGVEWYISRPSSWTHTIHLRSRSSKQYCNVPVARPHASQTQVL